MQTTVRNVALGIAILAILIAIALFISWIRLSIELPPQTPVASTPAPLTLLDEQFDSLIYNGSINYNLWTVTGETRPEVVSHIQSNGELISTMQTLESGDSEIHSIQRWQIEDIDYAEWRVKFDESVDGGWASLALGLATDSDERFTCDLKFYNAEKGLSCVIWSVGQNIIRVTQGNIPLQANKWYILRISVINSPLEFKVYLDNELVTSYIVKNPTPWESNKTHIYSSLAGDGIKNAITTRIDYAVVTGK